MKRYLITTAILAVGVSIPVEAADMPNPAVGECAIADVVVTRGDPTFIDPDGPVTGLRIWQVCGYQVPTGVGSNLRAVDDEFVTDLDLDDATAIAAAAEELLGD